LLYIDVQSESVFLTQHSQNKEQLIKYKMKIIIMSKVQAILILIWIKLFIIKMIMNIDIHI